MFSWVDVWNYPKWFLLKIFWKYKQTEWIFVKLSQPLLLELSWESRKWKLRVCTEPCWTWIWKLNFDLEFIKTSKVLTQAQSFQKWQNFRFVANNSNFKSHQREGKNSFNYFRLGETSVLKMTSKVKTTQNWPKNCPNGRENSDLGPKKTEPNVLKMTKICLKFL